MICVRYNDGTLRQGQDALDLAYEQKGKGVYVRNDLHRLESEGRGGINKDDLSEMSRIFGPGSFGSSANSRYLKLGLTSTAMAGRQATARMLAYVSTPLKELIATWQPGMTPFLMRNARSWATRAASMEYVHCTLRRASIWTIQRTELGIPIGLISWNRGDRLESNELRRWRYTMLRASLGSPFPDRDKSGREKFPGKLLKIKLDPLIAPGFSLLSTSDHS